MENHPRPHQFLIARLHSELEFSQQLFHGYLVMRGDVFQDAGQRPDLERLMVRNDFVILPINLRGYADCEPFWRVA
jgi:hypothetical protein